MMNARASLLSSGAHRRGLSPASGDGCARSAVCRADSSRAFSLAELMIALTILGLGLLFIAAALPVGLEYTRQTVDMGNAEAAGEYALAELKGLLRTSGAAELFDRRLQEDTGTFNLVRRIDCIHRPREKNKTIRPGRAQLYAYQPAWEPIFKVRPFVLGNVSATRGNDDPARGAHIVDDTEAIISQYLAMVAPGLWGYLGNIGNLGGRDLTYCEYDFLYNPQAAGTETDLLSLVRNPVLSGLGRVYPPVQPVTTFQVGDFFANNEELPTYRPRTDSALSSQPPWYSTATLSSRDQLRERGKVFDRRIGWTAFYRRVSYRAAEGVDGAWFNPRPQLGLSRDKDRLADDIAENDELYEIIIVVTRRPTINHRYAMQDVDPSRVAQPFSAPQALPQDLPDNRALVGTDRVAPTPWLVSFVPSDGNWVSPLPQPTGASPPGYHVVQGANPNYQDRVIDSHFGLSPRVTFRCQPEVGKLLAAGAVVIPALNDQRFVPQVSSIPGFTPPAQYVGFVPSCPESLPIYTVIESRPPNAGSSETDWEVVCEGNSFYPWVNPALGLADPGQFFPVWVIPPAFDQRDSVTGQPIFDREASVMAVLRRTIRLPEIGEIAR